MVLMLVLFTVDNLPAEQESLQLVIDRHLITAGNESAVCSDTEFLRRVFLDLIGLPPAADEVREFAADLSPDKRRRIVDRLLDSPHCDRHLTATFDVMLMERRANQHVPQDVWHNWLLQQVRERRPWNEVVQEILRADGDDPVTRPAARFFLDRQSEPHLLTRDVGRIFFGHDLQCAQCHNHPLIDDYLQADYHGLHAFLAPGYAVVRKVTKKEGDKETIIDLTVHAEKAGNDLIFESVFFQGTTCRTGPRLLDDVSVSEQFLYPGDEYEIEPADGIKSVPKISRRAKLAEMATCGTNRAFNENIANRLWAHMLGRGLVHPVDLHHFDNPPSDPELLKTLGQRFADMRFDVRGFLREIAMSRAYQRPFDQPDDLYAMASAANTLLAEQEQQLTALKQAKSQATATCEVAANAWDSAQTALGPVAAELDKARKVYDEARKALKTAEDTLTQKTAQLQVKQKALPVVRQAAKSAGLAAEMFSDDADLNNAAELFASRVGELEQSISQLTVFVKEQTTAVEAPRAAFATKKESLDGFLAQLPPLDAALRESEAVLLEKRRQMQQRCVALAAAQREAENLRQIVRLSHLRDTVNAARTERTQHLTDSEAAQQQLIDQVGLVMQHEERVTEMAQLLAEAGSVLEQANEGHDERVKSITALQTAIDATEAARRTLPGDRTLAEVSTKLNDRLRPLQSELTQARAVVDRATEEFNKHKTAYDESLQSLNEAVAEREQKQQTVQVAETAAEQAQADLDAADAVLATAVRGLTMRWTSDFTIASLKPLTPEQLCWSMLKVTGVYDKQRKTESDSLATESPLSDEQQTDSQQMVVRNQQIEQKTYEALKTHVGIFVRFYAAAAGQPQNDFFATADQALFTANANVLNSWVAPADGNVTERIITADTPSAAAEELYLAVLNRHPSDEEVTEVSRLLGSREQERKAVAKELVWGLMTSIEFRFNH